MVAAVEPVTLACHGADAVLFLVFALLVFKKELKTRVGRS